MPAQQTIGRPELVRVFRSMTRQFLLAEYSGHETSPSRVAERLGLPLNLVAYHTKVLVRAGFLELVGTRRIRGALEHTYRSVDGPPISDGEWAGLPPKVRRAMSRLLVGAMSRDAHRALDEGGMDGGSTHLSRSFLQLDADGREQLSALLHSTLEEIGRIEAEAKERGGRLERVELQVLAFDEPTRR